MARKVDPQIIELASRLEKDNCPIKFFKRFLDDIFMIYTGSVESLHLFLTEINNIHPSIKFTMSHTTPLNIENPVCGCKPAETIPFLDTSCQIVDGKILTDLYRKETDRNQYLLTSSCHPAHVTENIPFSLALRIVRICSLQETREKRFSELKDLLLSRGYKARGIDAAIDRARKIPRLEALKRVVRSKTARRPVFVITYDPRLPSISGIVKKHWRSMVQDPHLAEVFPLPPLIAYKRPANIRDKLIRSKIPTKTSGRPKREVPGMKKCLNCPICPFVQTGRSVKSTATNYTVDINTAVNCQSKNIIYALGCNKCSEQYVGESERTLQDRFSEHKGYVTNSILSKATGNHFNQQGHKISDMKITIIEKVHSKDPQFRKQREKMYINKMNTKYKGMNRKT